MAHKSVCYEYACYRFVQVATPITPPIKSPMASKNIMVLVGCPPIGVVYANPIIDHPATINNIESPIFRGLVI